MENKKRDIKRPVVLIVILLILLGLWMGYVRGDIGMSEHAMREDHRDYVKDGCTVYENIGNTMAAFLDYNAEMDDYDLDIYVKREGSMGWFFRFGGASGALDHLVQMNCEGNDEYVLTYLSAGSRGNTPAVSRIEVQKENGNTMTITPEVAKPFAYVMDQRWNVVVYSEDGSILQPVERSM